MAYTTNLRLVLKNINNKGHGTLYFEINFVDKETKQKARRFVNLNERLFKNDFNRGKIKNSYIYKTLKNIVDKKKVELEEQLRIIKIEKGDISPQIYDDFIRVSEDVKKDVISLFEEYIETKRKRVDEKTIKKYISLKNALIQFIEEEKLKKIYLSDIDVNLLDSFTDFLAEERELAINTINKYQSDLITFLDYLTNTKKINKNLAYKDFKKTPRDRNSNTRIVLLKDHVKLLVEWKPINERYEKVRDLFLFQILTGIRFSVLERVTKSWVNNGKLNFIMYKVPKSVSVPLHDIAMKILKKYNYELGEVCKSIQNYNQDLKEVGKLAGLTDTLNELKITLNRKIPRQTKMYKLLTSHVGRASFITNLIVAGVSPYIIMSYTGHSKITTLDYYFKLAGDMDSIAFEKFKTYMVF
jgi:integrase